MAKMYHAWYDTNGNYDDDNTVSYEKKYHPYFNTISTNYIFHGNMMFRQDGRFVRKLGKSQSSDVTFTKRITRCHRSIRQHTNGLFFIR